MGKEASVAIATLAAALAVKRKEHYSSGNAVAGVLSVVQSCEICHSLHPLLKSHT